MPEQLADPKVEVGITRHYRITGTLTTRSPLRLGAGFQVEKEASPVLKDDQGRPCLSGSSLKGFLRARLGEGHPECNRIFGAGGDQGSKGLVTVDWAFLNADGKISTHWGVSIEPVRSTAETHHLFQQEEVPEDTTFAWALELRRATESDLRTLLGLLQGLDGKADCTLGHGGSGLQGRVEWKLGGIQTLDWNRAAARTNNEQGIYRWNLEKNLEKDLWASYATPQGIESIKPSNAGLRTFTLRLSMTAPFLVNDPSRVESLMKGHEEEKGLPSLCCHCNAKGQPSVPWTSLKGTLRAHARKILMTLAHQASAIPKAEKKAEGLLDSLFGTVSHRSPLQLGDAQPPEHGIYSLQHRAFLPIDRFLGAGGSEEDDLFRPYNVEVGLADHLEAEGLLEASVLEDPSLRALLFLLLRDAIEGDLALGWGQGRGLGSFKASLGNSANLAISANTQIEGLQKWLDIPNLKDDLNALATQLGCPKVIPAFPVLVTGDAPREFAIQGRPPQHLDNTFHPPYLFVPTKQPIVNKLTLWPLKEDAAAWVSHARHDRWVSDTFSGRLLCSIHLETPTFVGTHVKEADEDGVREAVAYKVDDRPAIPGSSLRGMVSSLAEALSCSALRVLKDRKYSVRKPMNTSLGALGLLRPNQNGGWEILPLTLPPFQGQTLPKWRSVFGLPDNPTALAINSFLPVYLEGYKKADRPVSGVTPKWGSFLQNQAPFSFGPGHQEFWLAPHTVRKEKNGRVLGLQATEAPTRVGTSSTTSGGVRGILRILAAPNNFNKMPSGKKHEFFLPFPEHPVVNPVLVPLAVIERFRNSAEGHPPFCLKGSTAPDLPESESIMYFDVNEDGTEVTEISISAIWRKSVDGSAHDFFRGISPDLLPWGPDRNSLTPAELLFGVVAQGKDPDTKAARDLKGRVSFSDAILDPGDPQLNRDRHGNPVVLRILASPKPPSPGMYFQQNGNHQIPKDRLACNGTVHRPRGRKVYLHHVRPGRTLSLHHWQSAIPTESTDQKRKITPLASDQTLRFHLDFNNLLGDELSLLLTALRPSKGFRHRLGLGKPLGLGTVCVTPEAMLLVDRQKRYRDASGNRWAWAAIAEGFNTAGWQNHYPAEAEAVSANAPQLSWSQGALVDTTTFNQVLRLGEPERLAPGVPVVPVAMTRTQLEAFNGFSRITEEETFLAFTCEDLRALPTITGNESYLAPMVAPEPPLPNHQ